MNQASDAFSLGYSVWQRDGEFFIGYKDLVFEFEDNMVFLER